ncbi:hypothetical protein NT6N_33570 [Oceaniferula spumae]|uniref:Uncharacterized protein n=1 Tax=Oceaniferula spumae TaxID=2979115 RepID=A0AAT9FQ85_9BACT
MRIPLLSLSALFLGLLPSAMAEDTTKKTAPSKEEVKAPDDDFRYRFGSIKLPPDFFIQLDPARDNRQDDDPFGGGGADHEPLRRSESGPIVPQAQLPRCLPTGPVYRDISKLLNKQGVSVGEKQWILVSGGLGGDYHLYYCLDRGNADIVESILMACHSCGPFNFRNRLTLVSVPNQGLGNDAWTRDRLLNLSPRIHARYGTVTRSGERSVVTIKDNNQSKYIDFALEPVLAENGKLTDLRLEINLAWNSPNAPNISQRTSFTQEVGNPFILDCGTHGDDRRNYLLMIESGEFPNLFHHQEFHHSKRIKLKKIDGIYAMNPEEKTEPKSTVKSTYKNFTFRCASGFMDELQIIASSSGDEADDPFTDKNTYRPVPAALRVKNFKPSKHMQPGDSIFDITPHCQRLGLVVHKNEWVYYNKTASRLIIHGTVSMPSRAGALLEIINRSPRMVRINASIVEIDVNDLTLPDWTMEIIAQHQIKHLAKYSATCRSGEKGIFGMETKRTSSKDPKTGEVIDSSKYEFETEPTISEGGDKIDLRFSVHSQPLGDENLTIAVDSSMTIPDGKPAIIDLGHPNSATKIHLLILNADVIRPDGSFYRERYKPLAE